MNTHQDIQARDAAPAAEHTTVIRSEQAVASVTFAPPEDGRWFRVLNSVVDRGEWASLTNAARNVLVVLARHAGQDGTSCPGTAALKSASGLRKTAIYDALAELEAGGLIVRTSGRSGYIIFPNRPFASRSTPRPGVPGELSAGAETLHEQRRRLSATADGFSATAEKVSATADSPKSKRDLEGDEEGAPRKNGAENGGGGEVSGELRRLTDEGGMSSDEARGFIARFGAAMAVDSLDNALWRKRAGKLAGPVKAYAWHSAQKGYGPFREVRAEREAAEAEAAAMALKGILDSHLSREEIARVAGVFGGCRKAVVFGAVTPGEIRTRDAGDVARLVVKAAAACTGSHPSQFRRVLAQARNSGAIA